MYCLILFKADWCKYCNNFKPKWQEITNKINQYNIKLSNINKNLLIHILIIDADENKIFINNFKNRFNIKFGFPSIFITSYNQSIFYEDSDINQFQGDRYNVEEIYNFIINFVSK